MAKDTNDKTTKDLDENKQTQPYKVGYTYIVNKKLRQAAHMIFACSETEANALAKIDLDKEHGEGKYRLTSTTKW